MLRRDLWENGENDVFCVYTTQKPNKTDAVFYYFIFPFQAASTVLDKKTKTEAGSSNSFNYTALPIQPISLSSSFGMKKKCRYRVTHWNSLKDERLKQVLSNTSVRRCASGQEVLFPNVSMFRRNVVKCILEGVPKFWWWFRILYKARYNKIIPNLHIHCIIMAEDEVAHDECGHEGMPLPTMSLINSMASRTVLIFLTLDHWSCARKEKLRESLSPWVAGRGVII